MNRSKSDNKRGKAADDKRKRLDRKLYEDKLEELQIELVRLQEWVKHKGLKIVIVFEGR
ncbi:MAG: polyphosphate kinase 2, partial [Acidobacteriota bacterium]